VALARVGCTALAHRRDLAVAHGDIAAVDDAVGEDDRAAEGKIEVAHAVRLPCPVRRIRTRSRALRLS
jgi:hypothetical protein